MDRIFTFKQLYYYKETTEIKKLCSSCSFWSHVSVQKSPDYETLKLTSYFDPEMVLFKSFQLRGIPTTLLVKQKFVIAKKEGIKKIEKKTKTAKID